MRQALLSTIVLLLCVSAVYIVWRANAPPPPDGAERDRARARWQAHLNDGAPSSDAVSNSSGRRSEGSERDLPAEAAWSRLVADLEASELPDPKAARQLIARITAALSEDTALHTRALTSLRSLDASGNVQAARVLAVAIGMTPDESLAFGLLRSLRDVQDTRVKCEVIRALAQNRHGVTRRPGAWAMSSDLLDLNTSIQEPEIVEGLLLFGRAIIHDEGRQARMLVSAVVDALMFSAGEEGVAEFLIDLARSRPDLRAKVIHALGFEASEASLSFLWAELQSASDTETLRYCAVGLARLDAERLVDWGLSRLRSEGVDPDQFNVIVQALAGVRTANSAVLEQIQRAVAGAIASSDRERQQAGLLASSAMDPRADDRHIRRAVETVIRDERAPMSTRIIATKVLRWDDSTATFLASIVGTEDVNYDLRIAALERALRPRPGRVLDVVGALGALQVKDAELRSRVETAVRELEARDAR